MSMPPLVSVIIPVYNVEQFVRECLCSVLQQSYMNLEIIVINDGSEDRTYAICEELRQQDSRIILLNQNNAGVVSARNAGIEYANGEYMVFLDGDDWVEQNAIEMLLDQIGSADMVSAGVFWERAKGNITKTIDRIETGTYEKDELEKIWNILLYDEKTRCLHPMTPWLVNKIYVSSLMKEVYKNVDTSITYAEDSVLLFNYMLCCSQIRISDVCFYHYRYREDSAAHAINPNMLLNINRVYIALRDLFMGHAMKESLLYQLQKWVVIRSCVAINEQMGFDRNVYIPQFVIDTKELEKKKIVLYGAGRVGKDVKRQLDSFGYEIILWVDRICEEYQKHGMQVEAVETINNYDYDVVYIAIENERVVKEIFEDLLHLGIERNKLIWRKPMRLF